MLTTTAAGRTFDYSYCMGMVAMSGNGFTFPVDFAMTADGVVYVINRAAEGLNQRVTKCTVDHEFIGQFGNPGSGDGQFTWPMSIDLDQDENVYVCDEYLQRISIFDADGKFLGKWGQGGSGDGELHGPSGLAFDRDDNLYVVDSLNHRVQKFTKDGKFLGKWGQYGTGEGEFNMPWGLCLDRQGDVYVADWKNSRVQKFSPDGGYLATFAASDSGVGAIHRPTGVAVDSEGDVYITDWHDHQLRVFSPEGRYIMSLVGDAQQLSPWAQEYIELNQDTLKARRRVDLEPEWRFHRPVAVNVDAEDRVFVLESSRGRIQIYNKEKDFEEAPLNL
jgi:DNA-binding beta-propeller fold protein YncE